MNPRRRFVSTAQEPAQDVKTSRTRPSPSAFQGLPSGASMAAMKRGWHAPSTEQASVPVHAASKRGFRPPTHEHVAPERTEVETVEVEESPVEARVEARVAPVAPAPVAPVIPAPVPVAAPAPSFSGGRRRGSSANFGGSGPSVSAATRRGWRPPDLSAPTAPGGLLATRRGYAPPDASASAVLAAATVVPTIAPVAPVQPAPELPASNSGSRRRGHSSFTASPNTVAAASRRGYQQPNQGSMGPSSAIAASVKRGWKPPEESPFTHQPVPSTPSQEGMAATEVRRAAYQAALAQFQAQAEKQRLEKPDPEKMAAEEVRRALLSARERILASGGILPAVADAVAAASEVVSAAVAAAEVEPAELPAGSIEEVDEVDEVDDVEVDEVDVPEDDADLLEGEDAFDPSAASREDLIAFLASRGVERLGRQHVRSVKSERLRSEVTKILAAVVGALDDESPSP